MEQNPFLEGSLNNTYLRLLTLLEDDQELSAEDRAQISEAMRGLLAGLEALRISTSKRAEERERLLVQIDKDHDALDTLTESLARERDILRTAMEHTDAQLAYLDTDFRFVRVNAAYAQGSGHSQEELIGRHHFDLFPNPENQAIFEWVRDTGQVAAFQAKPFTYPGHSWRGTTYWDWTLRPVRGENSDDVQGLVLSLVDVTDKVQAAEVLRQGKREFESLADHLPDIVARFDRNLRYLYVNPAVERLTGLSQAKCLGKTNRELGMPEDLCALWDKEMMEVFGTGRGRSIEFESDAQEGERHFEARLAPEFGPDGAVASVLSILRDITERNRTRKALQRYAERLEALHRIDEAILAAGSAEGIAQTTLPYAQQLVSCVRASVSLFEEGAHEAVLIGVVTDGESQVNTGVRVPTHPGWPSEELAQGQVRVVEDIQSLASLTPLMDTLLSEGIRSFVNLPLMAEGELIGTLDLGFDTPGRLDEEQLEIAREMADQLALGIRQTQLQEQVRQHSRALERTVARRTAALRSSEARFRTVFEGAAIGIALLDTHGRIAASNPALQEILGYSEAELRDRTFAELTHPDDLEPSAELYAELVEGKRDHYHIEKRYVRKDGKIRWVRPTVSFMRRASDSSQYTVKMVEDITEQKQAHEALISAERLSIAGQLGASLAHEINNPLQSVIGCLGLAEESLAEGGEVSRYLEVAREELRRAARIVAQLRDLHRHTEPENARPTDLNALLERVLVLVEKELTDRDVEVVWEKGRDLVPLMLVSDRIQQVILNIVLNAKDAMPAGGLLRITTSRSREPDGVSMSFADTGTGIADDELDHIFDAFFSTKAEGLGLGLYVTRRIVEEHGGEVTVESQVGKGTTFTVWFPA